LKDIGYVRSCGSGQSSWLGVPVVRLSPVTVGGVIDESVVAAVAPSALGAMVWTVQLSPRLSNTLLICPGPRVTTLRSDFPGFEIKISKALDEVFLKVIVPTWLVLIGFSCCENMIDR
jgi:hypothetical protein